MMCQIDGIFVASRLRLSALLCRYSVCSLVEPHHKITLVAKCFLKGDVGKMPASE